jgi:hypothetical protein
MLSPSNDNAGKRRESDNSFQKKFRVFSLIKLLARAKNGVKFIVDN